MSPESAGGAGGELVQRQQPEQRPGENAASRISVAPASVAVTPGNNVWPIAAPPSASTATMANFDRISAIRSSTARTAHRRLAGQTRAAKNSGSIKTITYTAAERISSSTHRTKVAATASSPTKKATNGEREARLNPADRAPALARNPVSACPAADETTRASSSDADSSSIVTGAAMLTANRPSGR